MTGTSLVPPPALEPDATIGILGGGQLGRMLALAAARLGCKCHIFSPSPDSPAFDIVHRVTCADYGDTQALDRFAADVDVVTYEFENVPADTATFLAAVTGQPVDGNAPRNLLDGPGYKVVDLAISRTVPVHGTARLTFRVEATNAFNLVNLGQPGNAVGSATFGVIRTANAMRKVQLGIRLSF